MSNTEEDFEKLHRFLLSDQLDHKQMLQLVSSRPEFKQWLTDYYRKKYNADNNISS